MLRDNINKEIAAAMKAKDANKLYVLKMIKAKFLEFKTSKGFKETDFTDAKEISIIQKMEKSWSDEINSFKTANRDTSEMEEKLNILKSYLPKEATIEEIKDAVFKSGFELKPQNMRNIMQYVQNIYPTATGKQIADIIKNNIK